MKPASANAPREPSHVAPEEPPSARPAPLPPRRSLLVARAYRLCAAQLGVMATLLALHAQLGTSPGARVVTLGLLALAIAAAALSTLLFVRSIAAPLGRITAAARSFGEGDLTARAALSRDDELGDVSLAFDEMADRVGRALRGQKELLANVSHELRTPLARIRVALDLAAEGDAETARVSLGEIGEDLAELERLVTDVLRTARFELASQRAGSDAPPLRRERIEAEGVARRAVSRFQSLSPGRVVHYKPAPSAQGAMLSADADMLRRVLDNLLDNARKYSSADDPIELAVECIGEGDAAMVRYTVSDRGIGIPEKDLQYVGTPFFRTDRSRARSTGGIGLGVSLAQGIVEAHGGQLSIASREGQGTTVTVRLPRLPASG